MRMLQVKSMLACRTSGKGKKGKERKGCFLAGNSSFYRYPLLVQGKKEGEKNEEEKALTEGKKSGIYYVTGYGNGYGTDFNQWLSNRFCV